MHQAQDRLGHTDTRDRLETSIQRKLHYTTLHCTALHCTALHCTALHFTSLHCTALHFTAQPCTALDWQARPQLFKSIGRNVNGRMDSLDDIDVVRNFTKVRLKTLESSLCLVTLWYILPLYKFVLKTLAAKLPR